MRTTNFTSSCFLCFSHLEIRWNVNRNLLLFWCLVFLFWFLAIITYIDCTCPILIYSAHFFLYTHTKNMKTISEIYFRQKCFNEIKKKAFDDFRRITVSYNTSTKKSTLCLSVDKISSDIRTRKSYRISPQHLCRTLFFSLMCEALSWSFSTVDSFHWEWNGFDNVLAFIFIQ